jgi:hypothetical protein
MKKYALLFALIAFLSLGGCTQVVTAPIHIAGAAVGATLDVAGAAGGAVVNTVTGGD